MLKDCVSMVTIELQKAPSLVTLQSIG